MNLAIVVAPTVRESDGLALSSRNSYLLPDERRRALVLSRALRAVERAWRGGMTVGAELTRVGDKELATEPAVRPDYFALVDPDGLEPVGRATTGTIALVAARVGATRLIDNLILGA
jgi:pantoate--beta-alanine ligase